MATRPQSIRAIIQHVEDLAVFGGAHCAPDVVEYLNEIGVGCPMDDRDGWCYPNFDALLHLYPAVSNVELCRRLAIRDPLYRYHLDLTICATVHAIGRSQRWQRFEQVLRDSLEPMTPRILQVIRGVARHCGVAVSDLAAKHWVAAGEIAYGSDRKTFETWDRELWGESRGAADLFPLLLDLYVPLCDSSVFVQSSAEENRFLSELVGAAKVGEGLRMATSQIPIATRLARRGLPIEIEEVGGGTFSNLVASIAIASDGIAECDSVMITKGIPKLAVSSRICPDYAANPICQVRPAELTQNRRRVAVLSIPCSMEVWPDQDDDLLAVPWGGVPAKADLDTIGKWVSGSEASDAALLQLATHPLFGFLFQVLLIEALDRELGNETLVFALRPNQKLNDAAAWAGIKVLFREPKSEGAASLVQLGLIDTTLAQVAQQIGIERLATPYAVSDSGAWSTAFALMNSAGLVDGTADGWILTLDPLVFDRLHRGSLMKEVIRGGRQFRDSLIEIFCAIAADSHARNETVNA